jgi:DNA-binding transcriptional LysR family regulator
LTEAGVRFHAQVGGPLAALQEVVAGVDKDGGQPAGTLKVSMGQAFGRTYLVPLLGDFLARYPAVVPDWHFENRQVDLIGEGFDAAIGGGFRLAQGVVARELGRVHIVAPPRRRISKGARCRGARRTSPASTASSVVRRRPGGYGRGRSATRRATRRRSSARRA